MASRRQHSSSVCQMSTMYHNRPTSQIPQCLTQISHNATFCTEMCAHVHISVTEWGVVKYGTDALWYLCNRSNDNPVMLLSTENTNCAHHETIACSWGMGYLLWIQIWSMLFLCNWPNSQIPQCTCSISHNAPFRTEMCTFLFWMVYYWMYEIGPLLHCYEYRFITHLL